MGFIPICIGWLENYGRRFLKQSCLAETVDNLKLRVYGVLGNQNIGLYPYQQTYSLGYNYPIGNPAVLQSGAYMASYNNQDITWEKPQ